MLLQAFHGGPQGLPEIGDDVLDGFDPHRQAHHVFADPGGGELRRAHLLVGGARRMNHQGLGVADVGQVTRQPQSFDELRSGRAPAFDAEAHHGAGSARQQPLRQLVVRVGRQTRMHHPRHGIAVL